MPLFVTLRQTDYFALKHRPDLVNKMKKVLTKCSVIFYITPYIIDYIEKKGGSSFFNQNVKNKLVFIPNIVERKRYLKNIKPKNKLLLTVLNMTKEIVKRKNIKNLFKAIRILEVEDLKLNIIGDGDYLDVVKSWAKKYRIQDKVTFLGAIPNEKLDNYFKEAQAFVLPSRSETFGLVYAESLLNGTLIM